MLYFLPKKFGILFKEWHWAMKCNAYFSYFDAVKLFLVIDLKYFVSLACPFFAFFLLLLKICVCTSESVSQDISIVDWRHKKNDLCVKWKCYVKNKTRLNTMLQCNLIAVTFLLCISVTIVIQKRITWIGFTYQIKCLSKHFDVGYENADIVNYLVPYTGRPHIFLHTNTLTVHLQLSSITNI